MWGGWCPREARGGIRPEAASRHPIRIAVIRATRYALLSTCYMDRIAPLCRRLQLVLPYYFALCTACVLEQQFSGRVIQNSDVMRQNRRPKTKLVPQKMVDDRSGLNPMLRKALEPLQD